MAKQVWKAGNMLYPVPAVMISVKDKTGRDNILTVAWTGTVCTNPPMLYISVRKERYSHKMLKDAGEFVVNLTTEKLAYAADYCGVRSGRDVDKWAEMKLTREKASRVNSPLIKESPVNIECKITQILELGSHDMFLAEVAAVDVDDTYLDEKQRLCLGKAGLMAYSHGEYYGLGKLLGTFGYSVSEKKNVTDRSKAGKRNQIKKERR